MTTVQDLTVYLKNGSLDELLTDYCLNRTIGDVVQIRESARRADSYFVSDLLFSAVFEMDMTIVTQIINRIDGTVPASEEKDQYANLTGMAIQDVMTLDEPTQIRIMPDDPVLISIAKAIYVVATSHPKTGTAARKDKQLACEIILNRVGGRKTAPVRPVLESRYTEPEWMRELEAPESDSNG